MRMDIFAINASAANALAHRKLPVTEGQFGATFRGPIARDQTVYFANFEQRMLNQSGLITITPERPWRWKRQLNHIQRGFALFCHFSIREQIKSSS